MAYITKHTYFNRKHLLSNSYIYALNICALFWGERFDGQHVFHSCNNWEASTIHLETKQGKTLFCTERVCQLTESGSQRGCL